MSKKLIVFGAVTGLVNVVVFGWLYILLTHNTMMAWRLVAVALALVVIMADAIMFYRVFQRDSPTELIEDDPPDEPQDLPETADDAEEEAEDDEEVSLRPFRIEPISIKLLLFLVAVAILVVVVFGSFGAQEDDELLQGAWFISAILVVVMLAYVFICYKEVAAGRRALQKEGGKYTGKYYPTGPHLVWKPVYFAEDVEDEVEYAETTVSGPTRSRDGVTPGISMTVTGKTEYKRNWTDLNEERVPYARLLDIDLENEVQSFAAGPMVQALGLFYQEQLIRSLDVYVLMVGAFMMLKERPEAMPADFFPGTPGDWRDSVTGVILPEHMVEFYTRYQAVIRTLVAESKEKSVADIEDMLVIIMMTFLVMRVSEGAENRKTGEKQPETAQDRGQMDLALARQAAGITDQNTAVPLDVLRAIQVSTGRPGVRVVDIVGGKSLERAAAVFKETGGGSTPT